MFLHTCLWQALTDIGSNKHLEFYRIQLIQPIQPRLQPIQPRPRSWWTSHQEWLTILDWRPSQ